MRAEAALAALVPIDDLDDVDGPDGKWIRSGVRCRLFVVGVLSGRIGNDFEVVNDDAHERLPVECGSWTAKKSGSRIALVCEVASRSYPEIEPDTDPDAEAEVDPDADAEADAPADRSTAPGLWMERGLSMPFWAAMSFQLPCAPTSPASC